MTVLGQLALWLALLLALWGSVVGFIAGRNQRPELVESARRATYALAGVLVVASLALIVALVKHDFNVSYVASYTSRNLPLVYTLSAFYGVQAGSMLFWAVVLSCLFTFVMLVAYGKYTTVTGETAMRAFRDRITFGKPLALYRQGLL